MNNLIPRLKNRWNMTKAEYKNDLRFSRRLAWYRIGDNYFGRLGFRKTSSYFHKRKESLIIDYIEKEITEVIDKYRFCDREGEKKNNAPVWVCWWTGIETAPRIVKQCVKSIQRQSGKHPVHIITKDNYSSYIDIPSYMLEKILDRTVGLAHFSDYIRVSLLNQYGGLWLDATIYCSAHIPEWYFELPLFTCKSDYRESNYLSHYQWTTFCLGGWKSNVFYAFLQEAYEAYWKQNEYAIDYLFFDDMIWLAKERIPAIKKMLEDIPINTPHRDDLQAAFNANLAAEAFEYIINDDTPIYKLSWREIYSETTADGKESIYGCFLRKRI